VIEADGDLLWGLRGGGGNFGIVSRFEFDLHPVSTILGGLMMWPLARGHEVLQSFREWAADAPDEASLLVAINTAPPEPFIPSELRGQKVVAIVGCSVRCPTPRCKECSMRVRRAAAQLLPRGIRRRSLRPGHRAVLEHGAAMPSPMSQIHFHHMGGAVGRRGAESSYSGRLAGYTYNLIGTWVDPSEDEVHVAAVRATSAALAPLSLPGRYVNFVTDIDTDRVRDSYGEEIYTRLARLKRQYDPAKLLRLNQNVRPAR
jgi:hypothetical protein